MTPAYTAVGAAAGLHRYIKEAEGMEQSVASAQTVLTEVAGLALDDALAETILQYYQMLLRGEGIEALVNKADKIKHENLDSVI